MKEPARMKELPKFWNFFAADRIHSSREFYVFAVFYLVFAEWMFIRQYPIAWLWVINAALMVYRAQHPINPNDSSFTQLNIYKTDASED